MASNVRLRSQRKPFFGDMGCNMELRKNSQLLSHQNKMKGIVQTPRGSESIKYPDKQRTEDHRPFPHLSLHHPEKKDVREVKRNERNPKKEELVRHMKNLPNYLQRVEAAENFQGKALSVGVLDWNRLEKFTRKAELPKKRSDQQPPFRSGPISGNIDVQLSSAKPAITKSTHHSFDLNHQEKVPHPTKSFGRIPSGAALERHKERGFPQNLMPGRPALQSSIENNGVSLNPKEQCMCGFDDEAKNRDELFPQQGADRHNLKQKNIASGGDSLSKLRKYRDMISFKGKITARGENSERIDEKLSKSKSKCEQEQQSSAKQGSIVLLLPKTRKSSIGSVQEVFQQKESPRGSNRSSLDSFSFADCNFEGICSHSSLQPCDTSRHNSKLSSCAYPQESVDTNPDGEIPGREEAEKNSSTSSLGESLKTFDQETKEHVAGKGRHPSPTRRLSFSFGRMARSLSSKERPGPHSRSASMSNASLANEDLPCCEDSNSKKPIIPGRAKLSPLRRLFEPILKSKSTTAHHLARNDHQAEEDMSSSITNPLYVPRPLQAEGNGTSTVQALCQLTNKSGVPMFKFVVSSTNNILVATVRNSVSTRKGEICSNFTFYSVNELKKKKSSTWIGQGSKSKGAEFVYSVVGHMKMSMSVLENMDDPMIVMEYVLLGDLREPDEESSKFVAKTELAALVFKIPSDWCSHNKPQTKYYDSLTGHSSQVNLPQVNWFSDLGKDNNSTVNVILPGAIHSLPDNGKPSPLIQRWKTGGSCDCGGWDVGCKLRVLSSQNNCYQKTLQNPLNFNQLKLFPEGESQHEDPIYSLAPFSKEVCSVEFDSSISSLQAFSISVAIINHQMPSEPFSKASSTSEPKCFLEKTLNQDGLHPPTVLQAEDPAKYVPLRPFSPLGRV